MRTTAETGVLGFCRDRLLRRSATTNACLCRRGIDTLVCILPFILGGPSFSSDIKYLAVIWASAPQEMVLAFFAACSLMRPRVGMISGKL